MQCLRRMAPVAALVCLVGLAPSAEAAGRAAPAVETIQPGMVVRYAERTGGCTANFVYDGIGRRAGKTYIGIASHCVHDLSDPTVLDDNRVPFGRIVHVNWPLRTVRDDWALIEIFPSRLRDVDPAQRGNPQFPTGVAEEEDVKVGDEIRISGYGYPYYIFMRTQRSGVTTFWDGTFYDLLGPIGPGDSGGALVHVRTGKALGIVSAYCTPQNWDPAHLPLGCTAYGPSAAEVLRGMADKGFPVRMRLAGQRPPP